MKLVNKHRKCSSSSCQYGLGFIINNLDNKIEEMYLTEDQSKVIFQDLYAY